VLVATHSLCECVAVDELARPMTQYA